MRIEAACRASWPGIEERRQPTVGLSAAACPAAGELPVELDAAAGRGSLPQHAVVGVRLHLVAGEDPQAVALADELGQLAPGTPAAGRRDAGTAVGAERHVDQDAQVLLVEQGGRRPGGVTMRGWRW